MSDNYYLESLIDATKSLVEMRQSIYDTIFHVAMTGELSEWNKTIEIGTEIKFTIDIFEGCTDSNIHLLLKLMAEVDQTIDSLININGLDF